MRQSHNEEAPSHGNMSGKIRVSSGLHRMHQVTITHASLRHTNRYGWHISLKRKFTQISRHLFETHKIRLVTVKVVVAVRQHAKQTNKKLAHTAYVPEVHQPLWLAYLTKVSLIETRLLYTNPCGERTCPTSTHPSLRTSRPNEESEHISKVVGQRATCQTHKKLGTSFFACLSDASPSCWTSRV